MKKINYGILSTAQIVPRFVNGVKRSRLGNVTAIASRNLEKAQSLAEALDIQKAYGSYHELFVDEEVDIIYIATYNKGHYEAAKAALEHNKHVLLEKPFTLKAHEAKELFKLAKKRNLFIMEAQKSVFLPITQLIKKTITEGKIGEIKWIESVTSYTNIERISWFHQLEAGGGTLHGSGSYPLQYIQYLLDDTIEEYHGTATIPAEKSDTQCNLILKTNQGTLASIFITVDLDLPSQMTIYGSKGRIEIPYFWKTKEATVIYNDGKTKHLSANFDNEFVFEVDHVNQCLIVDAIQSPVMTKDLTVSTVKIVERLYQHWTEK